MSPWPAVGQHDESRRPQGRGVGDGSQEASPRPRALCPSPEGSVPSRAGWAPGLCLSCVTVRADVSSLRAWAVVNYSHKTLFPIKQTLEDGEAALQLTHTHVHVCVTDKKGLGGLQSSADVPPTGSWPSSWALAASNCRSTGWESGAHRWGSSLKA